MRKGSQQYKKVKKLIDVIQETDKENAMETAFLSILHCEDWDCKDVIDDNKKNWKNTVLGFINNANIDGSCLSRSMLHLNWKRFINSAKDIPSYVKLKAVWYLGSCDTKTNLLKLQTIFLS